MNRRNQAIHAASFGVVEAAPVPARSPGAEQSAPAKGALTVPLYRRYPRLLAFLGSLALCGICVAWTNFDYGTPQNAWTWTCLLLGFAATPATFAPMPWKVLTLSFLPYYYAAFHDPWQYRSGDGPPRRTTRGSPQAWRVLSRFRWPEYPTHRVLPGAPSAGLALPPRLASSGCQNPVPRRAGPASEHHLSALPRWHSEPPAFGRRPNSGSALRDGPEEPLECPSGPIADLSERLGLSRGIRRPHLVGATPASVPSGGRS
jgi:hypothetical protein